MRAGTRGRQPTPTDGADFDTHAAYRNQPSVPRDRSPFPIADRRLRECAIENSSGKADPPFAGQNDGGERPYRTIDSYLRQSAIDEQFDAIDVSGVWSGKEANDGRDVVGLGDTAGGCILCRPILEGGDRTIGITLQLMRERRTYRAGAERIDPDAPIPKIIGP